MRPRPTGRAALGWAGLVIVVSFAGVALLGPVLAPYEVAERAGQPFQEPSGDHPLGTDDVGYDILSELVHGTRTSVVVGVGAAAVATAVGTLVGLVSGYRRGWVDYTAMRLVDLSLVLPVIPLLIVLATYLDRSARTQVVVVALVLWAGTARVVRSQVLVTRDRDHVRAARTFGARTPHVLRRHLVPAVAPFVIVEFVRAVQVAVLLEASLSFLGLGDPVQRSWGSVIHFATVRGAFFTGAWKWWIVPPGVCIALLVVGFAFVGLWLEERADPRLARLPAGTRAGPAPSSANLARSG